MKIKLLVILILLPIVKGVPGTEDNKNGTDQDSGSVKSPDSVEDGAKGQNTTSIKTEKYGPHVYNGLEAPKKVTIEKPDGYDFILDDTNCYSELSDTLVDVEWTPEGLEQTKVYTVCPTEKVEVKYIAFQELGKELAIFKDSERTFPVDTKFWFSVEMFYKGPLKNCAGSWFYFGQYEAKKDEKCIENFTAETATSLMTRGEDESGCILKTFDKKLTLDSGDFLAEDQSVTFSEEGTFETEVEVNDFYKLFPALGNVKAKLPKVKIESPTTTTQVPTTTDILETSTKDQSTKHPSTSIEDSTSTSTREPALTSARESSSTSIKDSTLMSTRQPTSTSSKSSISEDVSEGSTHPAQMNISANEDCCTQSASERTTTPPISTSALPDIITTINPLASTAQDPIKPTSTPTVHSSTPPKVPEEEPILNDQYVNVHCLHNDCNSIALFQHNDFQFIYGDDSSDSYGSSYYYEHSYHKGRSHHYHNDDDPHYDHDQENDKDDHHGEAGPSTTTTIPISNTTRITQKMSTPRKDDSKVTAKAGGNATTTTVAGALNTTTSLNGANTTTTSTTPKTATMTTTLARGSSGLNGTTTLKSNVTTSSIFKPNGTSFSSTTTTFDDHQIFSEHHRQPNSSGILKYFYDFFDDQLQQDHLHNFCNSVVVDQFERVGDYDFARRKWNHVVHCFYTTPTISNSTRTTTASVSKPEGEASEKKEGLGPKGGENQAKSVTRSGKNEFTTKPGTPEIGKNPDEQGKNGKSEAEKTKAISTSVTSLTTTAPVKKVEPDGNVGNNEHGRPDGNKEGPPEGHAENKGSHESAGNNKPGGSSDKDPNGAVNKKESDANEGKDESGDEKAKPNDEKGPEGGLTTTTVVVGSNITTADLKGIPPGIITTKSEGVTTTTIAPQGNTDNSEKRGSEDKNDDEKPFQLDMDIPTPTSNAVVNFSCQPSCTFISKRNSHKISSGYHRSVDVHCPNCYSSKHLDHARFRVAYKNGTITDWQMMPENMDRSDVKAFVIQAMVAVEKDGSKTDIFSQIYENNQGPTKGQCTVSSLTMKTTDTVTLNCQGWSDEDGIEKFNIYSQYGSEKPVPVSSSKDPSQNFKLRAGSYKLFACAVDNLKAESAQIPLGDVVVTQGQRDVSKAVEGASGIDDVKNIIDLMKDKKAMNAFLESRMDTSKDPWANDLIGYAGAKMDKKEMTSAFRKSIQAQASEMNGLSEDEIQALADKRMREQNAEMAKLMTELLNVTTQKQLNSPEDLKAVVGTVNELLEGSMKSTMKKRTPGEVPAGDYRVQFGRIRLLKSDLIIVGADISIDGTTVFMQGDIQPAKVMMHMDEFKLDRKYMLFNAQIFLYQLAPYDVFAQTKLSGVSPMLDGAHRIDFFDNNRLQPESKHVAWNASFNMAELFAKHQIENASFTTYMHLLSGSSIILSELSETHKKTFFQGEKLNVLWVTLKLHLGGQDNTLKFKDGVMEILKVHNRTFDIFIHGTTWTNKDSLHPMDQKYILDTIKLENVDKMVLTGAEASPSPVQLNLDCEFVRLQTRIDGVPVPPIVKTEGKVESSRLVVDMTYISTELFLKEFKTGNAIKVHEGRIKIAGSSLFLFNNGNIALNGDELKFATNQDAKIKIISKVRYEVESQGDRLILTITNGTFDINQLPHLASVLDIAPGQRLFLDGGQIARNCSNCLVIKNARITSMGKLFHASGIIGDQSLIDQNGLGLINSVLDNTDDFLKKNAHKLSDAELKKITEQLLGVIGKTATSMKTALENPLKNDLDTSLAYEMENYDELFIALPENPEDIRYVEEYTEEDWAAEAVWMRQKASVEAMRGTMKKLFGTLEEIHVTRALESNDLSPIIFTVAGTSLVATVGLPKDLLATEVKCLDWTVKFPPMLKDLNVKDVKENEMIRTSMICMDENLFMYSKNASELVTTGTADLKLKRIDGTVIDVKKTKKPIVLASHNPKGDEGGATTMLTSRYERGQALDYSSFRTSQANSSITIEFETTAPLKRKTWIFVRYQHLPGPLPHDHDWRFDVKGKRWKFYFHIPADEVGNRTGLFYVGVGTIADDEDANNPKHSVRYNNTQFKNWVFDLMPRLDYTLKVVNKGCYFYHGGRDRFDNFGLDPKTTTGMKEVTCYTDHLTDFSVGQFAPPVKPGFNNTFSSKWWDRRIEMVAGPYTLMASLFIVLFCALRHDYDEVVKGGIQFLADNKAKCHYLYVVVVETGYGRYCRTDSGVFINIEGTEYIEVNRRLKGVVPERKPGLPELKQDRPFMSGRTDRFLLTTRWPLGDIKKLTLWTDSTGLGHRESWYCEKVTFLDLHTNKTYVFDVKKWFGMQTDDPVTLRSFHAAEKKGFLGRIPQAFRLHSLAEHICWFNCWNGGGMRTRYRFSRVDRTLNMAVGLFVMCFVNALHANYRKYIRLDPVFTLVHHQFTIDDFIYGFLYALTAVPTTVILPILLNSCLTDESEELWEESRQHWDQSVNLPHRVKKTKRIGWSHRVGRYIRALWSLALVALFFGILQIGIPLYHQEQHSFGNRFFTSFALWILVDGIKGIICSLYITLTNPRYPLINQFESRLFAIYPGSEYNVAPADLKDPWYGEMVAKQSNVHKIVDHRMRDDQMFKKVKEIAWYVISLFVLLGLSYYSRDYTSYMYQRSIRAHLNIDVPQTPLKNDTSYMKITKAGDFWIWARKDLVNAIRVNWKDGKPAFGMRGFMNDKTSRLMGYGTIRQIRSQYNRNCKIVTGFQQIFDHCQGKTGESYEDKDSYKRGWRRTIDRSSADLEYFHRSTKELMGKSYWGEHDSYSGGGYVTFLNGSASALREKFHRLERERWIDDRTRAIFVEFSAYNAQINMFAVVQLLIEVPLSGAYHPQSYIEAVRLEKYIGDNKNWVIFFEICFITYAILSTIMQIYDLITIGLRHCLTDLFKLMEFTTVVLTFASVTVYISRLYAVLELSRQFEKSHGNLYVRLDNERDMELNFLYTIGGVIFLTTFKMINILSFNRRIGFLATTLRRAFWSILGFGLCFSIVMGAFSLCLQTMLYSKIEAWRNFTAMTLRMVSAVLGKSNAMEVRNVDEFAGFVYIIFMLVAIVFLANVFIMIVIAEFEEVRRDPDLQTNDYEFLDHVRMKVLDSLGMLQRHHLPPLALPNIETLSLVSEKLEISIAIYITTLCRRQRIRKEEMQGGPEWKVSELERLGPVVH
ncbi:hypothetical protein QR680_014281 [Steinernema hermaphroditum]|uniref:PLAT domain-containing protein n=1 Tax=Steinernema hermaphroditum TaxID=289476 RepID=A0AA39I8C4_9BILA|nr:hypothetical protein QR680_014281 [Steinernema hermaphroditum]